jgi:sulfur relay (sulfurtransferase) complex TusBCD TusD component (DsrE family)
MANYLLIESRDPFSATDVLEDYTLASDLKQRGNDVTLFLVQNGVLPARTCAHSERLSQLAKDEVTVLADRFSLSERGISRDKLVEGVASAELDVVVDALAAGHKTIWF